MVEDIEHMMFNHEKIRNIGIVAHIDHGKTTLSDTLLAGAGLISQELAGKQLYMDFDELEQQRGITINAANVSMIHQYKGEEYLINLIDTPGHVDFGGDVTRAMRAVDGAIVVVCAVEGIMPQTETVLRQALIERVKPTLFINKVDRLINELKLTPEAMQQRFISIITDVNKLIKKYAADQFKTEWLVNVNSGSVSFGSAYNKWAINIPIMKERGITFKDIIEYNMQGKQKELAAKTKLHEILLDMVIRHLPNPRVAQSYRIPKIWLGDVNSEIGKSMMSADVNGKLVLMVTNIKIDPNAGEVATGRMFSGVVERGQEVYLYGKKTKAKVQQVGLYMGPDRVPAEKIPAGNIVAITGVKEAFAGETICAGDIQIEPFEEMKHYSEPVVTVAVEAKSMKDLPKLVEVLRQVAKEDPTVRVEINEETGEHLISGMGELHLEIIAHRIKEKGMEVDTSQPIVVYRESAEAVSPSIEGKSPNKHNRFYFTVEPLDSEVLAALAAGDLKPERYKSSKDLANALIEKKMEKDEAKGTVEFHLNNALVDTTKGVQHLNEVMPLVQEGFHEATDNGPLAKERVLGIKVKLTDIKLHEDSIHRGPAQVIPAVRDAIREAMLQAKPMLLEPKQKIFIHVPTDYMSGAIREIQSRRGQIIDMKQEGELTTIEAKAPVAELFGFASAMRSSTEGRALWATEHAGFEKVPYDIQEKIINEIRKRKGLGG